MNINNELCCGNAKFSINSSAKSPNSMQPDHPSTISIAWCNLRCEVNDFRGLQHFKPYVKKPILQRLNGFFEYHSLNALMGPSGAGKTMLLNCLSGTSTSGRTSDSEIYVASSDPTPVSYFIQQHVHETIEARLTVRQILQYAFKFKNGIQTSELINRHIATTLTELLLNEEILERPFEKCSGGEQRRIAIGQELMALQKPSYLFIDEPTSGLDSFAALEVVKCLSKLAQNKRMTIITSIHAPSDELLHYFNKLYVLARGGVCIYSGSPHMLRYHLEHETNISISQAEQPIEALIKIACNNMACPKVQTLANLYLHSEYQQISAHLPSLTQLPSGLPNCCKSFSFADLYLQIVRQSRITFLAQYQQFVSQLCFFTTIIFAISTFFNHQMVLPNGCYKLEGNSTFCENDILNHLLLTENINYLCLSRTNEAYIIMVTSAMFYSSVVKIFTNEHRNRWYSLGVFYWAASIVSLLQITIFAVVLSTISYFAVSEHAIDDYQINWHRYSHYIFCTFICLLFIQSLGQLVGAAIIGSIEISIILSSTLFTLIILLDDFFFKTDELKQQIFIYASDLLAMKYVTRYLIYVFYGMDRCDRDTEFSWVMAKNYSDENQVSFYIARLLVNALVIRILTFVLMYFKFNSFQSSNVSTEITDKPIPIDFNQSNCIDLNANFNIKRTKANFELQFEQFSKHKYIIGWRNLTLYGSKSIYEINSSEGKNQKPILRNLSGQFKFGSLNALMGMSGAGKTSLLKVLNGRHHTRLSNESQFYLSKFAKIEAAFITQEVSGHLMKGLTPKQLLVYASKLKNGTKVNHEQIALKLLVELNLADAVDTQVENCSGGERKRLALALELTSLQMPNLICIDEPTSGLDSNSAEIVISTLRSLTQNHPITIIASIHQPNTELLRMFDQLYVLAFNGFCVYSGPPTQIDDHLKQILEIATTACKFPIETLIKHSSSGHGNKIVQKLSQITSLNISKSNLALQEDTQLVPDGVLLNRSRFSFYAATILSQRYFAYIRGYLWKEWLPFIIFYLIYGFNLSLFFDAKIAIPSGCMHIEDDFNNTCSKSDEKQLEGKLLFDNLKYNLFFSNLFVMIVMMQTPLNLFKELGLFFNEHRNGWYSTGSFYLMKVLFEILPLVPLLCIYVYICNIYESVRPGIYWHIVLVIFLTIIATQALAYIFLISCNLQLVTSMIAGIGIYVVMLFLSNLFNSLKHLHYIYQFMSHFSIPRYTLESLILLEYGFGRCKPREIQPVLYWMDLTDEDYVYCMCMLVFNVLFYRSIALWMLTIKVNPRENRRQRVARIEEYAHRLEMTN